MRIGFPTPAGSSVRGSDTASSTSATTGATEAAATSSTLAATLGQDTFVSSSGAPGDSVAKQMVKLGVMGEAQAARSINAFRELSADDQASFKALLDRAGSATEQAYLYKALGAGYGVAEVAAFADKIRGWSANQLLTTLNLADPVDDGIQNGIKQQWETSCTGTSVQAVRGELDPVYALEVRTSNSDIHEADDNDAMKLNPALAQEQKHLVEEIGDGKLVARSEYSGWGTWAIDAQLNSMSAHTGYTYQRVSISPCDDSATIDTALEAMRQQLAKGIPTPIVVGNSPDPSGHCALALAVEGSGEDEKFLIHDPWDGTTAWWSHADIEQGQLAIAGWNRLGYYYEATPAPLGMTPSTSSTATADPT